MGKILLPGQVAADEALNQPVTRRELEMKLQLMERDFDALAVGLEFVSIRYSALLRLLVKAGVLDDEVLARTVQRLVREFIPYLRAAIRQCSTIKDRCIRAKEWNASNPDFLINLDDLSLLDMARWATAEDSEAMKGLPRTAVFDEEWIARGGFTGEVNDEPQS